MEDTNVATQDVVETTTAAATDAVKDADEAAVSNAKPNKRRNNDDDVPEEKLMEMFDFSKPIPRVERPDKAAHQAAIDEKNAEITALESQRDAITEKINAAAAASKQDHGAAEARKELSSLFEKSNVLKKERESLIAMQKQIRATADKLAAERKSASQSVRYNSVDEIESEIARLQRIQSTTSMSLQDEKKLLKEIDLLVASKRTIANLDAKKDSLNEIKKSREELNVAIDAKKKELDAVYKQIDAQRKIVDEQNSKHESTRAVIPGLVQERNGVRNTINSIKADIRTRRDAFRVANNEWYNYTRAVRLQRKMQYEEEKKKREEEEEARRAAKEAEEAKKIPYEEEMGLCDYLVKYLQDTYLSSDNLKKEVTTAKDESATVKKVVDDPFANFKPITSKKNEDDDMYLKMGKGKSVRKKNKKQKDTKNQDKVLFKLNVDTFEQFGWLNLNPPMSLEAVPSSIEELKAKKVWYSEQPRGSVPTAYDIRKKNEQENNTFRKKKSNGGNGSSSGSNVSASGNSSKGGHKQQQKYNLEEDGSSFVPLGSAASTAVVGVNSSWGKKGLE